MNTNPADPKTAWTKRLKWRKFRLYLVWAASFVICLVLSFGFLEARYEEMITPQISRAYAQVANMMPQLENNVTAVALTWGALTESRKQAAEMGIPLTEAEINASEGADVDSVLTGCFAIDRIIHIKVGHSGSVVVVRQDNGEIVAHPNAKYIGSPMMVSRFSELPQDESSRGKWAVNISERKNLPLLDVNAFQNAKDTGKFDLKRLFVFPGNVSISNLPELLHGAMAASIAPYGDYYIVCGVDGLEYLSFMGNAVLISLIACVMLWLFVHYICLMLERHEENARALRTRLLTYVAILTVAIFCMSWYIQVLSDVTSDLKAMRLHSDTALDTLKAYRTTQKKINDWLDEQYLLQCRIAGKYVQSRGRDQITREDLRQMSRMLGVVHIYLYDQTGEVIVTNSPYDHRRLGDSAEEPSYAFRTLLEGVDHVIQPPMADEISGARTQFIGVGLRSEADLADGFVMVSVDPALRDGLIDTLSLEKVLENMIIGLPEHALALEKETLNIIATTGPGLVGQPVSSLGINEETVKSGANGFLDLDDVKYYTGSSDAGDLYLMPVVRRMDSIGPFLIALRIAAIQLAALLLIVFLALYRYQESVVDGAPEPEPEPEEAPQTLRDPTKKGFEKRWGLYVPRSQQTPGEQTKRLAINLMLVFCTLNLIPFACYRVLGTMDVGGLNALTYLVSGHWEKGVNIFALSSCVFLLFALYVLNIVWERILCAIARTSDARVETVCLLLRNSLKYVCMISFIYYGLSEFGIPTQALLASAGILTLAVSMGAKDFVNDMIAGFFILMEGHIKVGDFVAIGGKWGIVQQLGIRTIRIVWRNETRILNNSALRDVFNSDGDVAPISTKMPVSINANLSELEAMLNEELPKLTRNEIPGLVKPVSYKGISKLSDYAMELSISASVENGCQSAAESALNRQIKLIFERRGIEIPVPVNP